MNGIKRLSVLFAVMLFVGGIFSTYATTTKDVAKMGNIWIITVDKSGSMIETGSTGGLGSITHHTVDVLSKTKMLKLVDFSRDRFLFLTSGWTWNNNIGYGNELRAAATFDKSFIHPTDGKLHSFSNKQRLIDYIEKEIMSTRRYEYSYKQSFVSQIRTFSIVHAVKYLQRHQQTDSFDKLFVMTITDDADQNDQWRINYRELKKYAKDQLKKINKTTSEYIYNELNGSGEGYLEEVCSDESGYPHIWLYSYKTRSQVESMISNPPIKIGATDGVRFTIKAGEEQYKGDQICFFHIDEVVVNGVKSTLNTSFDKDFETYLSYDNKFKHNNVSVYGWFQVRYNDPIYGVHYKKIPFEVHEEIMSVAMRNSIIILLVVLLFILLCILLYLLVIRPRRKLFTIYSGLGEKMVVKRGFRYEWRGEVASLQCYRVFDETVMGCVNRKHNRVEVVESDMLGTTSNEVLVCSRQPIYFSSDVIGLSTDENIKEVFRIRQNSYPKLLKEIYEASFICKLHDCYMETRSNIIGRILKATISLVNLFGRKYYYVISDIAQCEDVYLAHSTTFKDKRFLIECVPPVELKSVNDIFVSSTLDYVYSVENREIYDIVISAIAHRNNTYWNVIEVQNPRIGCSSLRNVKLLLSFEQKGTEAIDESLKLVKTYIKKEYRYARIGQYKDVDGESQCDELIVSGIFNILKPTAPAFISFVEDCELPKSQTIYSPIKDGQQKGKFVTIKSKYKDGLLYISLLPLKSISEDHPLAKRVSNTVVRVNHYKAKKLILSPNGFSYGEINNNY